MGHNDKIMGSEDWSEILHALTAQLRDIREGDVDDMVPGVSSAQEWKDHLVAIVGKIAARKTGELTGDDWDEISAAVDSALIHDDGGMAGRLREIDGRIVAYGPPTGDGGSMTGGADYVAVGREYLLASLRADAPPDRVPGRRGGADETPACVNPPAGLSSAY